MKQFINKMTYGSISKNITQTNRGTIIVQGKFTSDNRDETGDIITREATERAIPKYRQWGNIRLMHQPMPVAKVIRIGVEDGLDWNEVEIEVVNNEAIKMVEFGLLTAFSVGILVDFDNVKVLSDGGFQINDYQLAEISLVDHPANYDAKLKDLVLDQDARLYALQYGFNALKEQLGGSIMPKEKIVEQNSEENTQIESIEIEASIDTTIESESQIVTDEEVVEDTFSEQEEESMPEAQVIEEVVEAELENKSLEPSVETIVEEVTPAIEEETVKQEDSPITELYSLINDIKQTVENLAKQLLEAMVDNKGSKEEQVVDANEEVEAKMKALEDINKGLAEKLAQYEDSMPSERKGLVEAADISSIETQPEQKESQAVDLKKALAMYLSRK